MNADGSGRRRLTRKTAGDLSWSPDGRKIAFIRTPRFGARRQSTHELYVVNADGSGKRRLTRDAWLATPAWSPDGRRIAFVSRRDGNFEVYVMNADGSRQRRLTRNPVRTALRLLKPFMCGDGTFDALLRVTLDFTTGNTVGTWSVVSGTGAYAKLHGNGQIAGEGFEGGIQDEYTGTMHID